MILLIDNYDSFTYNLLHYFGELGANVEVKRNDEMGAEDVIASKPQAIVISPGPCDPDKAGICVELIKKASGKIPILGICLGHQSIGQAFGASIVRANKPMHGKVSEIGNNGKGIFKGLPKKFSATRYHSLVIDPKTLPKELEVTAKTADKIIMGIQHKKHKTYGLQFHPESILSEYGHRLLGNFLKTVRK